MLLPLIVANQSEDLVTPPVSFAICEGRLPEARFGWTLYSGYLKGSSEHRSRRNDQKVAALRRAVRLSQSAYGFNAAEADSTGLPGCDFSFVRDQAPTAIWLPGQTGAAPDRPPVLSLAHSGPLLLAAAGKPQTKEFVLGVDVEQLRERDFARIEAHMGWRDASSLRLEGNCQLTENLLFYRRWTLAESLYKALGKVNHECFVELESLALGQGRDSGWCSAVVAQRRWFVRWWCVTTNSQAAMVCLLRGNSG